jgi:hypothetical protein
MPFISLHGRLCSASHSFCRTSDTWRLISDAPSEDRLSGMILAVLSFAANNANPLWERKRSACNNPSMHRDGVWDGINPTAYAGLYCEIIIEYSGINLLPRSETAFYDDRRVVMLVSDLESHPAVSDDSGRTEEQYALGCSKWIINHETSIMETSSMLWTCWT